MRHRPRKSTAILKTGGAAHIEIARRANFALLLTLTCYIPPDRILFSRFQIQRHERMPGVTGNCQTPPDVRKTMIPNYLTKSNIKSPMWGELCLQKSKLKSPMWAEFTLAREDEINMIATLRVSSCTPVVQDVHGRYVMQMHEALSLSTLELVLV